MAFENSIKTYSTLIHEWFVRAGKKIFLGADAALVSAFSS